VKKSAGRPLFTVSALETHLLLPKFALASSLLKQVRSNWNFNTVCTADWSHFVVVYIS